MATVVISSYKVSNFPEGGGHFWVYMQYAQGLRQLGCDVYWMENFRGSGDQERDASALRTFVQRMERFGLSGKVIVYVSRGRARPSRGPYEYVGITESEAKAVFRRADLLLNFHYSIDPDLLACFRRTALVDIDPGLLQFWMSSGQLKVPPHDSYLTTGETLGTPAPRFSHCGLRCTHTRPPLSLLPWPRTYHSRNDIL